MLTEIDGPVLLVGAGKMGAAMAQGWLRRGLSADRLFIQEPSPSKQAQKMIDDYGLSWGADSASFPTPAIVVLAVKPQMMADVLPDLAGTAGPNTLFMSIAAGQSLQTLAALIGRDQPIVRVMPNTPAAIGQGMSVACANTHVSEKQARQCDGLLSAVGEAAWIDDEAQMDAVTAVSGSGPAYLFALTECLAQAGARQGLDEALAMKLARVTMQGAAALMQASDETPVTLRKNVTSPGGTTQAALEILLDENALPKLMQTTISAATTRSKELSG